MKTYGGVEVYADSHFLDLSTSCRSVVSFPPLRLSSRGKSPRYPLEKRLGGPQSRYGRHGENSWPYWDSNSDPLVVQPVESLYRRAPSSEPEADETDNLLLVYTARCQLLIARKRISAYSLSGWRRLPQHGAAAHGRGWTGTRTHRREDHKQKPAHILQ
jgi:hypothetical protein